MHLLLVLIIMFTSRDKTGDGKTFLNVIGVKIDGVHIAQSFMGEAMVYTCLHIHETKQEMVYTCLYLLEGMAYTFLDFLAKKQEMVCTCLYLLEGMAYTFLDFLAKNRRRYTYVSIFWRGWCTHFSTF